MIIQISTFGIEPSTYACSWRHFALCYVTGTFFKSLCEKRYRFVIHDKRKLWVNVFNSRVFVCTQHSVYTCAHKCTHVYTLCTQHVHMSTQCVHMCLCTHVFVYTCVCVH